MLRFPDALRSPRLFVERFHREIVFDLGYCKSLLNQARVCLQDRHGRKQASFTRAIFPLDELRKASTCY